MKTTTKVILVGHSWARFSDVVMVKARRISYMHVVGTARWAIRPETRPSRTTELLKAAETIGEQRAIRELNDVGRPPWSDGRGYGVQRKWANLFEHADVFLASTFALALTAPGHSPRDVNDWLDGQSLSAERLVPETSALAATTLAGEFDVPVFVIQGAEDFTTPTSLSRKFVSRSARRVRHSSSSKAQATSPSS